MYICAHLIPRYHHFRRERQNDCERQRTRTPALRWCLLRMPGTTLDTQNISTTWLPKQSLHHGHTGWHVMGALSQGLTTRRAIGSQCMSECGSAPMNLGAHRGQKRSSDFMRWELHSKPLNMDVGNQTQVLCRNSRCILTTKQPLQPQDSFIHSFFTHSCVFHFRALLREARARRN